MHINIPAKTVVWLSFSMESRANCAPFMRSLNDVANVAPTSVPASAPHIGKQKFTDTHRIAEIHGNIGALPPLTMRLPSAATPHLRLPVRIYPTVALQGTVEER